jgi:hypothetical protein
LVVGLRADWIELSFYRKEHFVSRGVSSDNRGDNRRPADQASTEAGLGSSVGADARVAAMKAELTKAWFSEGDIKTIAEKVPDLNVKILQLDCGAIINNTAADAVQLVKLTGSPVVFKFNDSVMVVSHGDSAESVVHAYMAPIEAERKAYWTPERIAEKEAREAAIDKAFEKLPKFFQKWISESGGGDYGRELDIGIAKDAHLVAKTLKTPEAIKDWSTLEYEEQIQAVPGISKGHSGFSFGLMGRLASEFLKRERATA